MRGICWSCWLIVQRQKQSRNILFDQSSPAFETYGHTACEAGAEDVTQQLWKDIVDSISHCNWISLHTWVTQPSCIFIWIVFAEHTWGWDFFQSFKNFEKIQLSAYKLVSTTTDGAPAMVGRSNGFSGRCREDDAFPDLLDYHYIIHQRALCAKMLNVKDDGCGNDHRLFHSRRISSKTAISCAIEHLPPYFAHCRPRALTAGAVCWTHH